MSMAPKLLSDEAAIIENRLEYLMPAETNLQKDIFDACRYSLLSGGKRLRPALCMVFYHLCGGMADSAYDFASAIEMIHSYSLIHDDLPCMDNSDMRRGKPSCHKVYGYSAALLAGDALLNRAFEIMTMGLEGIDPSYQLKAAHAMASSAGVYGMVGGQAIDLAFEGKPCNEKQLWTLISLKTASLIAGACESGCLLAGADKDTAAAAAKYGESVGLAFQIRDDILDKIGDSSILGKPTGEDEKKNTFASLYGIKECEKMVCKLTGDALECAARFDSAILKDTAVWLSGREF